MSTISAVAYTLAALWLFWCLYVFTMGLYRAFLQRRLKGLSLLMCAPVVAVAFVIDLVMQLTLFTVVFAELPRHWLVTHRLRAYLLELPPTNWRHRWANYLCHYLLDPFDPTGAHCDSEQPSLKA